MGAAENKKLMQEIFAVLAQGDSKRFVESMDDGGWPVTGQTKWSKTYEGKQAVLTELFGVLRERMADRIRTTAHRFIAEDDLVVVEARGIREGEERSLVTMFARDDDPCWGRQIVCDV
jgi:ketosteroid isomerase-like protein